MNFFWIFRLFAIVSIGFIANSTNSYACASCSSGGSDPLILYPNEQQKVYLGYSVMSGIKNIDEYGDERSSGLLERRSIITAAFGKRVSRRIFFSLAIPYQENSGDRRSYSSAGDPSINGRYTLIRQSIADPYWIPQLQFLLGFKYAQGTSIYEDNKDGGLNTTSNGFSSGTTGLDLWFGLYRLKSGLSYRLEQPLPSTYEYGKYTPGRKDTLTATIAFAWTSVHRTTTGTTRMRQSGMKLNGKILRNSDVHNNSAYITQTLNLNSVSSARLTYVRGSAFGKNRNTVKSNTVSFSWLRQI